jgi:hypothetical protein
MSTRQLAKLEKAIDAWMTENCEKDDWPGDTYIAPDLHKRMAQSAYEVFLASVEGQRYMKEQE